MKTSHVVTENKTRSILESHQIYSAPLSAAPDPLILAEWLNKAQGTVSYRRVAGIIENIRKMEELTAQAIKEGAFFRVIRAGKWMKPESIDATKPGSGELIARREIRSKLRLQRASVAFLAEIAQALKRYEFRLSMTQLLEPPSSRLISRFFCRIRKGEFTLEIGEDEYKAKQRRSPAVSKWDDRLRVSEGDAVLAVLHLEQRGMLDRIRPCPGPKCSKWVFAAKANYKFHTEECRLRSYAKSEEFKEKNRIKMKKYRERLKQLDQSRKAYASAVRK